MTLKLRPRSAFRGQPDGITPTASGAALSVHVPLGNDKVVLHRVIQLLELMMK